MTTAELLRDRPSRVSTEDIRFDLVTRAAAQGYCTIRAMEVGRSPGVWLLELYWPDRQEKLLPDPPPAANSGS